MIPSAFRGPEYSVGTPLRKTFNVLQRLRCLTDMKQGEKNLRVALDAVRLAEIGLFNTIHLSKLDIFILQSGSCFLVMRGKSFTVSTPRFSEIRFEHMRIEDSHHGAKNSTSISGSGLTTDSKLLAVKLMTSEPPSAMAEVIIVSMNAGERIVERRMAGVGERYGNDVSLSQLTDLAHWVTGLGGHCHFTNIHSTSFSIIYWRVYVPSSRQHVEDLE